MPRSIEFLEARMNDAQKQVVILTGRLKDTEKENMLLRNTIFDLKDTEKENMLLRNKIFDMKDVNRGLRSKIRDMKNHEAKAKRIVSLICDILDSELD